MNKQEVIKEIEGEKFIKGLNERRLGYNKALDDVICIVNQLDEPEKPVVPQFVADWIEDNREALEEYVYSNVQIALSRIQADNPMHSWLNGKGIGIIVDCVRNGYEVEKEKLYTVKFSNEDFSKNYIGIFKAVNKLGISSLPFNDDDVKSWFTEDELKKFKFWANPAFEIEEVEE